MSHSVWNNNPVKSSSVANRDKGFNNDDISTLAKMKESTNGLDIYIVGLKTIYDNLIKNQKIYEEFIERKINPKRDLSILDFENDTDKADMIPTAFFNKTAEWYGNFRIFVDELNKITFYDFSDHTFYIELEYKIRLLYKVDKHIVDEISKWDKYSGVIAVKTTRDDALKELEHFTTIYYKFADMMIDFHTGATAKTPQTPQAQQTPKPTQVAQSSPQISMPALKRVSILPEKVTIDSKTVLNEMSITCLSSPAPNYSCVYEKDGDVIISLVVNSAGRTFLRVIPIFSIRDTDFTSSPYPNFRTVICKHTNCNFADCTFIHQEELPNLKWLTTGKRTLPSPNAICTMLRNMVIDPNYNGEGTLIAQNSSF